MKTLLDLFRPRHSHPNVSRRSRGARTNARRLRFEPLQERVVLTAGLDWALEIANTPDQLPYQQFAQDVAADAAGNAFVAGDFFGTVDFDPATVHGDNSDILAAGPTNSSSFLAKYSPTGEFLWVTRVDSGAASVALDSAGNAFVAGTAITKISGAGAVLGETSSLAAGWSATDIAVGAGWVYLTSTVNIGGQVQGALAKYSSDVVAAPGQAWRYEITAGTHAVAIDGGGNAYVTGSFSGTVDFDPGPGTHTITGGGLNKTSGYAMKIAPGMTLSWVGEFKPLARYSHVSGDDIALDGSGSVYVGGWYQGSIDFDPGKATFKLQGGQGFITKLSSAGKFTWGKSFAADIDALALDSAGAVYGTGNFNAAADFDPGAGVFMLPCSSDGGDLFVVKLDSGGNFQWAVSASGTGYGWATGLVVTGPDQLFVVGFFSGELDFDPSTLSDPLSSDRGSEDGFVWKLKP